MRRCAGKSGLMLKRVQNKVGLALAAAAIPILCASTSSIADDAPYAIRAGAYIDKNPADQSREILSQMTWTMVLHEVDTDGDGVPDEVRVSGSNTVEILSETVDGGLPDGFPSLPAPPPLILPLEFEGILELNQTSPQ